LIIRKCVTWNTFSDFVFIGSGFSRGSHWKKPRHWVVRGALTKILEVKIFNKFDASRRLSIYYNMIGPLKTN